MRPRITGGFRFGAIKKDNNTQSDFKINKVKAKPNRRREGLENQILVISFNLFLGK